jgi:hypothetical protein
MSSIPAEDNFKYTVLTRHGLAVNAYYKDINIDHWTGWMVLGSVKQNSKCNLCEATTEKNK